ncbi:putative E3 ubiquitin-protein ligase XBAT35 isoform X2 [Juglans microcarpa x Juglans regia]|uniref:putative E3 ubiquitin-protein ligase XBAT35 isoform X2 n=1 Tax=Juglans microcarpa x Juglans regia TaxID=2249226 RepID=UPI001B7F0F58|nr:putative E3 ubiquitin-protein ligase XBAT35 isoform X2 [Juglans microcarpa x Juglans regia]
MGQQQSKEELLYQQVNYGNAEGIKALCREGAGLEWIDREGKTPLIVACLNPDLYNVAKTLIELGANINAYRPGRHAGTPLHHAAKRGLENTVKLLLLHGANALLMNDDCQTPLDVARAKGHSNVVRAIEGHICLFSGWLRELYGPGFLEVLAPQLVSRKVWVVVLPCGSRNPMKPFKLELAIYPSLQVAQPRAVISLWKANLEESNLLQSDPSVIVHDTSTKTRIKLAPASESDKQQLRWFVDACKGIPQAMHPPAFLHNNQAPVVPATAPPAAEDLEMAMAMAISASIQSAERPSFLDAHPSSEASSSTSWNNSMNMSSQSGLDVAIAPAPNTSSEWPVDENGPDDNSSQQTQNNYITSTQKNPDPGLVPSAPSMADEIVEDGPIQYPSIDSTRVDLSSQIAEDVPATTGEKKDDGGASSCVICLDAPVEGACIPCGHMVGCMSCLNEVKTKKWGCPVCRAKIDQVVRLYAV